MGFAGKERGTVEANFIRINQMPAISNFKCGHEREKMVLGGPNSGLLKLKLHRWSCCIDLLQAQD